MPSLPVDQHLVQNWPVLSLSDSPVIAADEWRLEVGGLVAGHASDAACSQSSRFQRWRAMGALHGMSREVRSSKFEVRIDVLPQVHSNFELHRSHFLLGGIISRRWEGHPLPRDHGGPCRMITAKLYAWKGAKWIPKIGFLDRNRRGFWERRGDSDTADPWFNDRYSA